VGAASAGFSDRLLENNFTSIDACCQYLAQALIGQSRFD
jgi:hypothetical protein